ncbi:lipoprotein signal peptidase [Alsobacter metallidurans]|uniref:Lipoprotein signal peptidase n=1 Tax=Alsobacter metallidurans TaxID=340221 RepID=A0A917I5H4_9HYPH|nr:signal peptidase II [Alsobacter metallidurans]GGH11707.1 lipoprotein signal peptidase [Alsobacter metallidurans]
MAARLPWLGGLAAAVALLADQASKFWILNVFRLPERPPERVGPVELVMVWNRGVSYGLFQQHEDWGRYLLVALSIIAAIGLAIWLKRASTALVAVALGLLIGGAIGNAIDRLLYGAVADFVLLYWIPFFPYVFNVADSAIVAGVALLLYDSVVVEGRKARPAGQDAAGADPGAGI